MYILYSTWKFIYYVIYLYLVLKFIYLIAKTLNTDLHVLIIFCYTTKQILSLTFTELHAKIKKKNSWFYFFRGFIQKTSCNRWRNMFTGKYVFHWCCTYISVKLPGFNNTMRKKFFIHPWRLTYKINIKLLCNLANTLQYTVYAFTCTVEPL